MTIPPNHIYHTNLTTVAVIVFENKNTVISILNLLLIRIVSSRKTEQCISAVLFKGLIKASSSILKLKINHNNLEADNVINNVS